MFIKRGINVIKRINVIHIEDNQVTITWEDNKQTVYLMED